MDFYPPLVTNEQFTLLWQRKAGACLGSAVTFSPKVCEALQARSLPNVINELHSLSDK